MPFDIREYILEQNDARIDEYKYTIFDTPEQDVKAAEDVVKIWQRVKGGAAQGLKRTGNSWVINDLDNYITRFKSALQRKNVQKVTEILDDFIDWIAETDSIHITGKGADKKAWDKAITQVAKAAQQFFKK